MRVLQLSSNLDLTEETLRAEGSGKLGPEHLDRHLATMLDVLGQVHRGHAALAKLPEYLVAAGEGTLYALK